MKLAIARRNQRGRFAVLGLLTLLVVLLAAGDAFARGGGRGGGGRGGGTGGGRGR